MALATLTDPQLATGWNRLQNALTSCRRERDDLAEAVDMRDDEIVRLVDHVEKNAKLHPLFMVLAQQFFVTTAVYVEERLAEGKPYVLVPEMVFGALGAIGSYMAGEALLGDVLLSMLNASLSVANTRYTSKRARLDKEGAAKAKAEKEAPKDAEK